MKYIDTHAHLNLPAFTEDLSIVVSRCVDDEVAVINVGTREMTSTRAVELALEHEETYAIIGLHPISTVPNIDEEDDGRGGTPKSKEGEVFNQDFYRGLIVKGKGKVVGIG